MSDAVEKRQVGTNIQSWLQQGEQLYAAALNDFRDLEAKLAELEAQLAAKQDEVNRIAAMLGKPAVDGAPRRASAEMLPGQVLEETPLALPRTGTTSSNATIARALTGKFGR